MISNILRQPYAITGACFSAYIVVFVFMTGLISPRVATLAAVVGVGALCAEAMLRGMVVRLFEKLGPMIPWVLFAMLSYAVLPLIPYAGLRAWNNLTGMIYAIAIFLVVRTCGRMKFLEPLFMSYVFLVACLFVLFPSVLGVSDEQSRLRLSAEVLGQEKGLNPNDVARLMGVSGLMLIGSLKGVTLKLFTQGPSFDRLVHAVKVVGIFMAIFVIIFHSGSRSALAWVTAILGYAVVAYFNRNIFLGILGAGIAALVGLTGTFFLFPELEVFSRITVIFDEVAMRGVGEKSLFTRKHMIQEALGLWKQSPLWGNGNEAYRLEGSYGTYSHTHYTELLANYGALGFLFFYFPIFWAGLIGWRMRKSVNESIRNAALWTVICCVTVFVISFANVIYYTKYMLLFFGFVLGRVYYLKDNYNRFNREHPVPHRRHMPPIQGGTPHNL